MKRRGFKLNRITSIRSGSKASNLLEAGGWGDRPDGRLPEKGSTSPIPSLTSLRMALVPLLLVPVGLTATLPFSVQAEASGVVAQVPVNARTIYVNPALGTDTPESGRENSPYRTISYALQQVPAGQNTVVQLAPGSYTRDTGEAFPLALKPGVILRGNESNQGQTVLIIGGGNLVSPTFARQNVTLLAANDSQIRGVTITNPNTRGTGVWVESSNPTIRDNTFSNSLREGVFVTGVGNPTIEDNLFTNNDANGVSVAREASGTIRSNEFRDTGFGVAVSDDAAPRIERNQIFDNVDGIVVSNRGRPILRRNVIQNSRRDGVVAIGEARPDLGTEADPGENIIANNGRYAVYNATRANTIMAIGNQMNEADISGEVVFVAKAIGFPDVQGHWAQAYIEALAEREVIGGFPDGTYRPNDPVTRAQFAAIVSKAFAPAPQRPQTNFVDVSRSFWGFDAVQIAYQGGFLTGYPGQIFLPNQEIPRVQALVSLASGLAISSDDLSALNKFADAGQIPNWASGAIAAATQRNLVVNYPDTQSLNPNLNATRADIAAFVYQALVNAGEAEPISSPYLVTYP
ncbi:MAG: DUF1565 domain-containing protein [Synechococcales bacterium]|nr:DUF1565 domain-containing protein [Synechococcales bacterium]